MCQMAMSVASSLPNRCQVDHLLPVALNLPEVGEVSILINTSLSYITRGRDLQRNCGRLRGPTFLMLQ
jgi:hypothetical protein